METEQIVSVLDHEAFAAKHMPDLGQDIEEFQVFHWKLQDWKKLANKLTSPEFDCGGHKWRILLFPFGNSSTPPTDTVSVYLDYANPKGTKKGWHACAQFALVISNPHDHTVYTVRHADHRFIAEDPDWGYTRFSELHKLYCPQPGHNHSVIEGDSTVVSVYVRVLADPTGAPWREYVEYDSKKQTGYVGLKNQGATTYMNTALQFLFHIRYFRKAIYQIPTEGQTPTESIPLALQRVFYNLQTSDQPVETTELTKSLGWKSLASFLSQDVKVSNRVLQHRLEPLMKGTRAEGAIPKIFRGKMKSFIKCVNVDFEESRLEEFDDIQLNVKGIKTLYDSFRDYLAVETLDGENKYEAEGFGLQDARKGIIFQSFPPMLYLQLKRYEYDMQLDAMVKVNDRFEFPFEIDLGEFLDGTADRTKPWEYELHSVFVHSGNLRCGRNHVLIKPDRSTRWLKFDNDRVTPVTDREVLEENYGGGPLKGAEPQTQEDQDNEMEMSTNAYILAYIRKAAFDEVMAPLTEEDTPLYLKRGLDEDRVQMEAKKKEQHPFLTVKVITDETLSRHEGFDLATFDEKSSPLSDLPTFRVLGKETYSIFKSTIAQRFGYPVNRIRLWVVANRRNKTLRPDMRIPENEPSLTVDAIRNNIAARPNGDLWLYLDILSVPFKRIWLDHVGTIMVFLKHFDTTNQSLFGIGKIHIQSASRVSDLIPIINERMGWASGTPLELYEEVKPGLIELMTTQWTLSQSEIQDGDVICFQVVISDQEVRNLESRGLSLNPQQFYDFLQNRMMGQQIVEDH